MLLSWKIRFVLSGAGASMAWRKKRRPRTLMDEAERPLPGGGPVQGAAPTGIQLKELFPGRKKRKFPFVDEADVTS